MSELVRRAPGTSPYESAVASTSSVGTAGFVADRALTFLDEREQFIAWVLEGERSNGASAYETQMGMP